MPHFSLICFPKLAFVLPFFIYSRVCILMFICFLFLGFVVRAWLTWDLAKEAGKSKRRQSKVRRNSPHTAISILITFLSNTFYNCLIFAMSRFFWCIMLILLCSPNICIRSFPHLRKLLQHIILLTITMWKCHNLLQQPATVWHI